MPTASTIWECSTFKLATSLKRSVAFWWRSTSNVRREIKNHGWTCSRPTFICLTVICDCVICCSASRYSEIPVRLSKNGREVWSQYSRLGTTRDAESFYTSRGGWILPKTTITSLWASWRRVSWTVRRWLRCCSWSVLWSSREESCKGVNASCRRRTVVCRSALLWIVRSCWFSSRG